MVYDPKKAHEYYIRNRQLKGRKSGLNSSISKGSPKRQTLNTTVSEQANLKSPTEIAKAKVERYEEKVETLKGALTRAQIALSKKRQEIIKSEKQNSDGKSTEQEKRSSKEYRDKHSAEIAAKAKKTSTPSSSSSSSSTGGSSTTSSSVNVDSMSAEDLSARIIRLKSVLADAQSQLKKASQHLGSLAHSAITSEPDINERFARYRSEERTLSHDSSGSGLHRLRDA